MSTEGYDGDIEGYVHVNEDSILDNFPVEHHNILLIGESRTGKSTFLKILENINFTTKLEIYRGTVIPHTKTILFKIDGRYIFLNIIDTPGFGEISADGSRSDHNLRGLIADFVKRDITKVSAILLAVNGSGGLTAGQVKNMTKCIKFLGKHTSRKTSFLVTHFENRTEDDEQKWIHEFTTNPTMRFLNKACGNGILFTGAINETEHKRVATRDSYILQQKRRLLKIFDKLLGGEPVSLMSNHMKIARSMFANQESVLTSCMNLRALIPEVQKTWDHAFKTRVSLSKILAESKTMEEDTKTRTEEVIRKMEVLGTEEDLKQLSMDENVTKLMNEYERIGEQIREKYIKAMDMNNEYTKLDNLGSLIHDELDWDQET